MKMKHSKYDGKEIWEKFMGMGAAATYKKIRLWLQDQGIKSSQMGPIFAMWRYAIRNPEEAYILYKPWAFEYSNSKTAFGFKVEENPVPTFEDFLKECKRRVTKARNSIISGREYRQFCQKYGLEE